MKLWKIGQAVSEEKSFKIFMLLYKYLAYNRSIPIRQKAPNEIWWELPKLFSEKSFKHSMILPSD